MISVEVQGMEKLQQKLSAMDLHKVNQQWLAKATHILQRQAMKEAPVDTWHLRRHIFTEVLPNMWYVKVKAPYGVFVHEGTRAHIITTKNKKVLSSGSVFFGKEVRHPWTKKNPFMTRAKQKKESVTISKYRTLLESHIKQVWLK